MILDAHRDARTAVFKAKPNALHEAAEAAQKSARAFGAVSFGELRPGLEPGSSSSTHALLLHDGEVPLSSLGLGTRRLTSLAIQDRSMEEGSIIAIDEIEHGLEPHRLAQALHRLRQRTAAEKLQIIMTTHSPVAVTTLSAADIEVVHADGAGNTSCRSVPSDLDNVQGTLRSAPDALLGRRVMVVEGATEVGVLRALLHHWDEQRLSNGMNSSVATGAVLVDGGGGAQSLQRAKDFQCLGYFTCALVDNDDPRINSLIASTEEAGIAVHRWSQSCDIEHEIIRSLPLVGVQQLVDLAVEVRGEQSVVAAVAAKLDITELAGTQVATWQQQFGIDEPALRLAIADAAVVKKKEWFKRQDRGEALGGVVIAHWPELADTPLVSVLERFRDFAYPDAATSGAADYVVPSSDA